MTSSSKTSSNSNPETMVAPEAPDHATPVGTAGDPVGKAEAEVKRQPVPPDAGRAAARPALALAGVAVVVAVVALAIPLLGVPDDATLALQRRIATLETATTAPQSGDFKQLADAVAALQARAEKTAADPRVEALQSRLSALETGLTGVGRDVDRLAQAQTGLDDVQARLRDLSAKVDAQHASSTAAEALVLVAGQLRLVLAGDQSYATELKAARALAGDDAVVTAALDEMAPFAAKGIPTRAQLVQRFGSLAGEAVRASQDGKDGDWVAQVKGAVSRLVTVRRHGAEVTGDAADAVLARAEAALGTGDLAHAVSEVSSLKGAALAVMGDWLADAHARLTVEAASGRVADRAVALFTAIAGGAEKAQ